MKSIWLKALKWFPLSRIDSIQNKIYYIEFVLASLLQFWKEGGYRISVEN